MTMEPEGEQVRVGLRCDLICSISVRCVKFSLVAGVSLFHDVHVQSSNGTVDCTVIKHCNRCFSE